MNQRECEQTLEATRFFADQMARLLEKMIPESGLVRLWREFSTKCEEVGRYAPGGPIPLDMLITKPEGKSMNG